jgi:hypothetical protein
MSKSAAKTALSEDAFSIDIDGMDVEEIVRAVKERVEKKRAAGVYKKYNLVGITRLEIAQAKSEEDFLRYHLKSLRKSWEIDIGDFEIPSKGGLSGRPAVWLKKVIWNLLRFYTFRMFTQQRDFNLQVVNTLQALNAKIDKLGEQIKSESSAEKPPEDPGRQGR